MKLLHLTALALVLGGSLTGFALAGAGAPGHHHGGEEAAFGKPGDPKKASRLISITMLENEAGMAFAPATIEVKQGEQIKFILRNNGALDHELVLATLEMNLEHAQEMKRNPDMEHDDPNAKRIAPKKSSEILWQFTKAGEFDFSCLIPGHREAGMHGKVVVSAKIASN